MKTQMKIVFLAGAVMLSLAGCDKKNETAAPATSAPETGTAAIPSGTESTNYTPTTEDERFSYAMGVNYARILKESLVAAKATRADPVAIFHGFKDEFNNKAILAQKDVDQITNAYAQKLQEEENARLATAVEENIKAGAKYREDFAKQEGVITTETGLLYKIEKEGDGKIPTENDVVRVQYRGKLVDGREFDSSYSRNEPFTIALGGVLPGWSEGIQHLTEGGKGIFVLPPELGFAKTHIPAVGNMAEVLPESTLIYEIELLKVVTDEETEEPEETAKEPEESTVSQPPAAATQDTQENKEQQK